MTIPEGRKIMSTPEDDMRAVILTESSAFGDETGAGIMRNRCAFTSRDMASDWPEAFAYAIVSGWDDDTDEPEESDAMSELAGKFDWDAEMVTFLRDAHQRFAELADKQRVSR